MSIRQKYLSACLLAIAALLGGTSPAFAAVAPPLGTSAGYALLSAAPGGLGAVTCTDATIVGDVGSTGGAPSVTQTSCTITGAINAPVAAGVVTDFNAAYNSITPVVCDATIVGTLAGANLAPGVYCIDSSGKTGTLTLTGPSNGIWVFKSTDGSGTGALAGTNFSVVMAGGGQACNVYWWTEQGAAMTDSNFLGTILAGAAIATTRGTFIGRALATAGVTVTGPDGGPPTVVTGCGALAPPPDGGGGGGGDPGPQCNLVINGNVFGEEVAVGNPVNLEFLLREIGVGNEMFLVLQAPAMGIPVFSYLTMTGQWIPLPADQSQITPFRLAPPDGKYPLFAGTAPKGKYELYLGCDFAKNGHLDYYLGGLNGAFDHLIVTVQ